MIRWPNFYIALLTGFVCSTSQATADDPPATEAGDIILVQHCSLKYKNTAHLGVGMPGVLQDCHVKLGTEVKAGEVMGRLRDGELRAAMDLYALESNNEIKVKYAEGQHAAAAAVMRSQDNLRTKNFATIVDTGIFKMREVDAGLLVERYKLERQTAELMYRKAEAELRAREIVAPHDGIVVEINKKPGETARIDEPIFYLVDVRHVQVEGQIDVTDVWRTQPGQPVVVTPDVKGAVLTREKKPFTGRLVFVDRTIDEKRQTCRVVAEVDNPDGLLRAGVRARMEILPQDTREDDARVKAQTATPKVNPQ